MAKFNIPALTLLPPPHFVPQSAGGPKVTWNTSYCITLPLPPISNYCNSIYCTAPAEQKREYNVCRL